MWAKQMLAYKYLVNIFWVQHFWSKHFVGKKKYGNQKIDEKLGSTNCGPKKFGGLNNQIKKILSKKFWQKMLGRTFWVNKFSAKKIG